MPAPKGHPPYNVNGEGGKPKVHTDEFIEKEAEELIKWLQKPENFFFKEFAIIRGYSPNRLSEFASKNERFAVALEFAKHVQEVKLFKGGLTKDFAGDFTKWSLQVLHGYSEKVEHKVTLTADDTVEGILKKIDGKTKDIVNES